MLKIIPEDVEILLVVSSTLPVPVACVCADTRALELVYTRTYLRIFTNSKVSVSYSYSLYACALEQ